eukprot:245067-Pyramimonas_sp.AAC.2
MGYGMGYGGVAHTPYCMGYGLVMGSGLWGRLPQTKDYDAMRYDFTLACGMQYASMLVPSLQFVSLNLWHSAVRLPLLRRVLLVNIQYSNIPSSLLRR